MLTALKSLFSTDKNNHGAVPEDEVDSIQLAFGALLVEAARADENYDDHERGVITRILQTQFELSPEKSEKLRDQAEAAQSEAIDLHRFTKEVKTLDQETRIAFLESLWKVVLSDGVRDPFEDALIRRVSNLIHLTDRESAEARKRVSEK